MSKPADQIVKPDPPPAAGAVSYAGPANAEAANAPDRTDFPCSVAQERFWLLDRLDPGNASYNVAVRWQLDGRVATDILERAWLEIIDRHEILRTVFLEVDGAPVQHLLPKCPFRLAEIDLSALPPDQRPIEGDRIGLIEARAPFDVNTGPLIRVTLLRFSPAQSIILVTTHQIVSDGWSIGVMAREMGVIYTALRNRAPVPLEPLPIQYADFSLWQLEWLRVRGNAAETQYWTKQLAGIKPFRVIPDMPRPSMPTTNGTIVSRVLPRALTDKAQALCVDHGATLFAGALGTLCAMLARYTKETDIVVGTQVSDRDQVETEIMIGQFVNSLVLRNDLAGNPRFLDILETVRGTTEQALEHRNIPIEHLLDMVKGEYGKTNAAPISVNFIFQKTFIKNSTYPDFALIDLPSLPVGAIYDLNFFMVERPDGWRFSLQYNTDQFEHETALRFLQYFQNALETVVADPGLRLDNLRLEPASAPAALLRGLHAESGPRGTERTAIEMFGAEAARAPSARALIGGGETLTYRELSARADVIAGALRTRGIGMGSRVAVCLPRAPDLVALSIALMRIGASCIPLDPADGVEFLRATLDAATASALVVNKETRTQLQGGETPSFDVEALARERSAPRKLAALPGVAGQTEAIFHPGFGSGTAISQLDLGNRLAEIAARIDLRAQDVLVAAGPLGSDSAIAELLLPLVSGACVALASTQDSKLPANSLAQLLKRVEATALHAGSDTYLQLQRGGWAPPAAFKALSSGDPLPAAAAQHLLLQGAELWTLYAHPTRGRWSALNPVKTALDVTLVGAPLGGAALSVHDSTGRTADTGATGLLALSRDGREPFAATGDLARLRATGGIERLGRADRAFQVAGHLVDPPRLEALLRAPGTIREAIVARGEHSHEGRLVACVTAANDTGDHRALESEIQLELSRVLPHDIVPVAIVVNGALPLERDGTLNWRALQPRRPAAAGAAPGAPLAGVEAGIAALWCSMLNLDHIDPEANFFELGTHSLLAARMLARLEATFGRRVTLNALFRAPTIRALARLIEQKDCREFDFRQMVKLQPNGSRPPLIAINNTGTYYPLAKRLGQDQPVISLQLFDPSVKTTEMPATLEEVAAGYVQLIHRVQPQGPYNLMGWCVAGALAFEIARQLAEAKKPVTSLYLMDSWVPRYIQRQPPLRRLIADYSLRWQLVRADWRLVEQKRLVIRDFLNKRNGIKSLRTRWNRIHQRREDIDDLAARKEQSREDYDKWLLQYLQSITAKYEPRRYPGRLTLFRSHEEPTGWLFDPLAGWGEFADSVELVMVAGDHYTMFQATGAQQIAERMSEILRNPQPQV